MDCDNHSRKDQQIDLWCAFPEQIADGALLLEFRCLLTEHEREREHQMHFARDRRRYLVTRALVRIVLSKYAPSVVPHEWAFTSNRYGKPDIANPAPQAANLTFNITHSGQLIVVGVARGIALGVDTENVRVRRAPLDIADDYFTSDEVVNLRAQSAEIQQRRFFEYWTLKESYIKARGMGLSIPLDHIGFRLMSRIGVIEPGMIAVMAPVGSGPKREFERSQECGFLPDFATAVSPFSGIGLGLRKLSPSMTMR